jgi:hypothetical protein
MVCHVGRIPSAGPRVLTPSPKAAASLDRSLRVGSAEVRRFSGVSTLQPSLSPPDGLGSTRADPNLGVRSGCPGSEPLRNCAESRRKMAIRSIREQASGAVSQALGLRDLEVWIACGGPFKLRFRVRARRMATDPASCADPPRSAGVPRRTRAPLALGA